MQLQISYAYIVGFILLATRVLAGQAEIGTKGFLTIQYGDEIKEISH